jgi:hypothetical protein
MGLKEKKEHCCVNLNACDTCNGIQPVISQGETVDLKQASGKNKGKRFGGHKKPEQPYFVPSAIQT